MQALYFSPFGAIIIISSMGKIVYLNWDSPECESKLRKIQSLVTGNGHEEDEGVIKKAENQLDEYFAGERTEFDLPLKFIGTEFQKDVWDALSKIRYGATVSYKELARMAGRPGSVRAAASACGANPIAIVAPCHRVVAAGGSLGGYTGGLKKKIALLQLENQERGKNKEGGHNKKRTDPINEAPIASCIPGEQPQEKCLEYSREIKNKV